MKIIDSIQELYFISEVDMKSYKEFPVIFNVKDYYDINFDCSNYIWDKSSTEDDDGYLIIKPISISIGRFIRQTNSINIKKLGAKGDGITDDTAIIIKALKDFDEIYFPGGIYICNPKYLIELNTESNNYKSNFCFILRSNHKFIGEAGKSVLKIINNFSSVTRPRGYNMFSSTEKISNVLFQGLTFNMNGFNNKIDVAKGKSVFGIRHTSAIFFGGKNGIIENLNILNCTFTGGPGTNCIVLGYYPGKDVNPLSNNVSIRNSIFKESGFNTSDFTYIYGWAKNLLVENCHFYPSQVSDKKTTGIAVEIHGSNSIIRNSSVNGLHIGFLVGDNKDSVVRDVEISNNVIEVSSTGIMLWRNSRDKFYKSGLDNIKISNNKITVNSGPAFNNLKYGIDCGVGRSIGKVQIINNMLTKTQDKLRSAGINIGIYSQNESIAKIILSSNNIRSFTYGVWCRDDVQQQGIINQISVSDNEFVDLKSIGQFPSYGIRLLSKKKSSIKLVNVNNNTFTGDGYGIYLNGSFENIKIDGKNKLNVKEKKFVQQDLRITGRIFNEIQ